MEKYTDRKPTRRTSLPSAAAWLILALLGAGCFPGQPTVPARLSGVTAPDWMVGRWLSELGRFQGGYKAVTITPTSFRMEFEYEGATRVVDAHIMGGTADGYLRIEYASIMQGGVAERLPPDPVFCMSYYYDGRRLQYTLGQPNCETPWEWMTRDTGEVPAP